MTAIGAHPGSRRALRQTFWITVAALTLYVGARSLPVGRGDLHYTDFAAGASGGLELCAPGGPQFVPVDRVASPVTMKVRAEGEAPLRIGSAATLHLVLTTASGKPVTEDDLLVVHTQKFHLLAVDPALRDYQHLHPVATARPGEYAVEFTPAGAGEYRFFADFTPRSTGRALYAGARVAVAGADALEHGKAAAIDETRTSVVEGYRFDLGLTPAVLRINEMAELSLDVRSPDGSPARLEEIMGAHAHVVAFDLGRTGFAHLHPLATRGAAQDSKAALRFELNLPDPGTYRLWAQVKIDGRELFAPFTLQARP